MKRTVALGIFSLILIFAFAAVPVVGILSVSVQNTGGENLTLDIPDSVGTGTVDTPLTKRQLQKKYAKYNTVAEENGKTAVTIFSEEQIDDFNAQRNNGEWFWLSTEEMLFLIEDTISLFETYDIVYIRGLDGVLHKYYGLSFFSSEEYFASFGGFDLGVTDVSFDLKQDVYETILERTTVLNCAVYSGGFSTQTFMYSDIQRALSTNEQNELYHALNPWYQDSNLMKSFVSWRFDNQSIYYYQCRPNDVYSFDTANTVTVYGEKTSFPGVSDIKYDRNGQVVIIELYETKTQKLIARLRYNDKEHPEVIQSIKKQLYVLLSDNESSNTSVQKTSYRAVIYFNFDAIGSNPIAIKYCPDGDLTLYSHTGSNDIFATDYFFQKGSFDLLAYINTLLKKQLL